MNAFERQKVGDEVVELTLADVDVGIAQQRDEIIGVGAEARILEVDDVEVAVVEHQIAAVIVAVAQHARLRRQLADDRGPFLRQCRHLRWMQPDTAIRDNEMTHEVLQLPGQFLDIECHSIRQVLFGGELRAASVEELDERDRLAVQRRVLGGRRRTEVGLQRHVAEVLQRDDAERIGVIEDRRDRQRHLLQQGRHVGERQCREFDRPRMQRQHDRGAVRRNDAEVLPVRCVAGERDHARVALAELTG